MVKFICRRCQSILSIPDDALPGKDLGGIKCALCQEPMEVERAPVPQGHDLTPLQMITAGGRRMLVAIAEQALADRVARAMSGFDWHIVLAQPPASALKHLEDTQYDVVVLHARSAAPNQLEDPVLRYLQRLPMPLRRAFLLCLLCDETSTLNYMAAFRAGANLIVNVQDVEKLQSILSHMLKQHQTSYAKFDDELRSRGTSPF